MADNYNTPRDINSDIKIENYGQSTAAQNNNQTGTVSGTVAETARQVVKSQTDTDENDFYTVSQKTYKTAAIASVFLPNCQEAQSINAYDKMDFSGNNATSQYLQSIGAADNIIHNHDIQLNLHGSAQLDLTKLNEQQMYNLKSTGQCTFHDGLSVNISPTAQQFLNSGHSVSSCNCTAIQSVAANMKSFDQSDFSGISAKGQMSFNDLSSKSIENLNLDFNSQFLKNSSPSSISIDQTFNQTRMIDYNSRLSITGAVTKSEKLNAMNTIYNNAMNSMRNDVHLSSIANAKDPATALRNCNTTINNLTRDIQKLTCNVKNQEAIRLLEKDVLTKSELTDLKKLLAKECDGVDSIMSMITSKNTAVCARNSGLFNAPPNSMLSQNGKRYIANYVLGDDMMKGVNMVASAKNTVEMGVRAAYALTNPARSTRNSVGNFLVDKSSSLVDKTISSITKQDFNSTSRLVERQRNRRIEKGRDRQEKLNARRGGRHAKQDYKYNKQQKRLNRKEERLDQHIKNSKTIQNKDRLINKKESVIKRREKSLKKYEKRLNRRNFLNKINPIKKVQDAVTKVISKILSPFNKIKIFLIGLASTFLTMLLNVIGVCLIIIACAFLLHFISIPFEDPLALKSKWANAINSLNSLNYEQMIADITTTDLCTSFEEVAKYDATAYYLKNTGEYAYTSQEFAAKGYADSDFNSNIPTPWAVQPEYGTLGMCWVWEEADKISKWGVDGGGHSANELLYESTYVPIETRQPLASANENIVPIFNMMHTRFYDGIDWNNWETALGYVYYMYAKSHDIAQYDPNIKGKYINGVQYDEKTLGYSFQYLDAHPVDSLYSEVTWLGPTAGVRRIETGTCKNIYITGTENKLSTQVLKYKEVYSTLFTSNEDIYNKTLMQFHSQYPLIVSAENGKGWWVIDDNSSDQYSIGHVNATATYNGGSIDTGSEVCTKFKLEVYDGTNYTRCNKPEHKHSVDAGCYPQVEVSRTLKGTCDCESSPSADGTITHTNACYDIQYAPDTNSEPICGLEEHEHLVGTGDGDCTVRVAICLGHCGGHLQPTVDIVEKMTYEGLIQDDGFKVPKWLTVEEVLGKASGGQWLIENLVKTFTDKSITGWKAFWDVKCQTWFSPFPRSCQGFLKTLFKSAATATTQEDTSQEDVYQFIGWWADVNTPRQEYLDLMTDFYGEFYNEPGTLHADDDRSYNLARDTWQSFADYGVIFNTGMAGSLSEADIQMYMDMFRAAGCNPEQLAILEEGLRRIGKFSYSCTAAGHLGGLNNVGGISECSGFVSGILSTTFGYTIDNSAAGYAHMGTSMAGRLNSVAPGSIVAHANGGSGYTGHVMIYAGYMENGPQGPGYYTIECTNSKGVNGSQLKKRSESYLNGCNAFDPTAKW